MPRTQPVEIPSVSKFFASSRKNPNPNWRVRINQSHLVSQASTILLQRHSKFWAPLLKPLKLSPNFTPSLFHQILKKAPNHPKICFNFFNWAQKNLNFKPDLAAQCQLIRILFRSEQSELGRPILNSIIRSHPPAMIVSLLHPRRSGEFQNASPIFNSVVECYCNQQMYFQGLEVYRMAGQFGFRLSRDACNALLNLLADKKELRLALCFYASVIRNGVLGDKFTWSVIAKILYEDGKFERISRILDMGMCTPEMFDLMIDGYSRRGDFDAAFDCLKELSSKGIEPSFSTFSGMLDGACRHRNSELIENVVSFMVEKGHITKPPKSNYDLIIKKLSDMGKTYAMDLFYRRASDENVELKHVTYECMFRALLSEEGRLENVIELYNILQEKNVLVSEGCWNEFVIFLCKEDPSSEINKLLFDIIERGSVSPAIELSNYIKKQCAEGQWGEAEELLNLTLDRGWFLDSLCLGSFVKRYCSSRQVDKATVLHNKIEELKGSLDMEAYNKLLAELFREERIEEAIKVFDYMKACKTVNSESFAHMIRGLCRVKEMRKAMKLHDEMLELGLKPAQRTYKRLISGFS